MAYYIIITVLSGLISYMIAARRNANKAFWLFMGILLGPLVLPFVLFAKTNHPDA